LSRAQRSTLGDAVQTWDLRKFCMRNGPGPAAHFAIAHAAQHPGQGMLPVAAKLL
jgi:hypothetical protein